MARVDVDWHGDEVIAYTDAALERAVRAGLRPIAETSNDRVPVQSGELKRSRRTVAEGNRGAVTYTDSKAVGAHENLTARLRGGKQPKFLEGALVERRDDVLREVADSLRDAL